MRERADAIATVALPLNMGHCHEKFVLTSNGTMAAQYACGKRARSDRDTCLTVNSFLHRTAALLDDEKNDLLRANTASSTRSLEEAKALLQQTNL